MSKNNSKRGRDSSKKSMPKASLVREATKRKSLVLEDASKDKKRYHITVTDSSPLAARACILDTDFDNVTVKHQRSLTPLYKTGSDKPVDIIPSAITMVSVSAISINHRVNPTGFHTALDPVQLSQEDVAGLMKEKEDLFKEGVVQRVSEYGLGGRAFSPRLEYGMEVDSSRRHEQVRRRTCQKPM